MLRYQKLFGEIKCPMFQITIFSPFKKKFGMIVFLRGGGGEENSRIES